MNYRELGNTGLMVSEIGLGCEGLAEDEYRGAKQLLDEAESQGINYFDLYTSNPQVRGAIGEALKGRRDKFIIQSHVCSIWKDGQYKRSRKIEEVKEGVKEMLSLLQTDYIDVGMIHYVDTQEDLSRMLENGMAVSIGRLREDTQYDYKFVCLSHNTLRGAAGGGVLLAELLAKKGYFD